jgi:CheY-like chemotaxis protein
MNAPRNKTLLFAEDEPELLEIYSTWFERLGYEVLRARNGKEALSFCRSQHVDLVISDVRMAGGSGPELARQLTMLDTSPLLVFLTGFVDLSNEEAYGLGACAILNKPTTRRELEEPVARFLKPARELWTSPLSVQPHALVEKNYDSLESALQARELNFGRGGMFVRDRRMLLPDNVPLGFQFRFAGGRPERMDGCGILRWQRVQPHQELPAGLGIEILHLGAQALDPVLEWISRANPKAFIPRE